MEFDFVEVIRWEPEADPLMEDLVRVLMYHAPFNPRILPVEGKTWEIRSDGHEKALMLRTPEEEASEWRQRILWNREAFDLLTPEAAVLGAHSPNKGFPWRKAGDRTTTPALASLRRLQAHARDVVTKTLEAPADEAR